MARVDELIQGGNMLETSFQTYGFQCVLWISPPSLGRTSKCQGTHGLRIFKGVKVTHGHLVRGKKGSTIRLSLLDPKGLCFGTPIPAVIRLLCHSSIAPKHDETSLF